VVSHDIFICHLLPVGQWQSLRQHGKKNSYKNGIAKVLRQANAQKPPKDYGIKTQPQYTEAIIFIPFPFGLRSCQQRLVAKHFLLHLFFIAVDVKAVT
jgi:hypothetical protein